MNKNFLIIKKPTLQNIFTILITVASLLIFSKAGRSEENDREYRGAYKVAVPVSDVFDLKIASEFRYNDNFSRYYRNQVDIGLYRRVADWFAAEINYLVVNRKSNGEWSQERRPYLNAHFSFKISGLSVSNRNRIEYRIKENEELWMYRNKLGVKTRKITSLNIQPYVADEIYYNFDTGQIDRNRVYAGLNLKIIGGLSMGLEYILEILNKDDGCDKANIIKTSLKYSF